MPLVFWLVVAVVGLLLAIFRKLLCQRTQLAAISGDSLAPRRFFFPFPLLFVALSCLALGAFWYQHSLPVVEPGYIVWYNDLQTSMIVEGLIVEPPDERDSYTNLRIEVQQLRLENAPNPIFQPVTGRLLARVSPDGDWSYGDLVRLEGQLSTPPDDELFSYRDYLARQHIHSYMGRVEVSLLQHEQGNSLLAAIYNLKALAHATIYALYPDPEASLLAGILLGTESGIPQDVQDAFTITGTSHIVAISGFNIAIIAAIFATLFGRLFGKKWGAVVAILSVIVYTILVGAAAAVVRAAVMGCLGIFAGIWGRRQVAIHTLVVTAAFMCLLNPHTLWDVGFQLSFAATLGLVLYASPLNDWLERRLEGHFDHATTRKITELGSEIFLLTLAAQLLTLPLIVYYFGRVSLTSFIVNPLVLPAQPALMILGGISVLLGMVWLPLGKLVSWLAWPLVAYSIRVIEWMATIPGGNLDLGDVALPIVILVYAVIFISTVGGSLAAKIKPLLKSSAVITILALLAIFTWRAVLSSPDGLLHITVLDVGLGDAILIQTPSGRNVLVDGGPSLRQLSQALGRRLPISGRDLDWLVVANPGDEQLNAVPHLLDRFKVSNVLWSGSMHGTLAARDLQAAIVQKDIPQTYAQPGHVLDLGENARLDVLTTGSRGAILLLTWDRFRFLLPLGVDFDSLEALRMGDDVGSVSALLLADGGYIASNPPEWIANLHPQVILLSVSPHDHRENPSPETLETIDGYSVLRTDQNGWIELISDGEKMWLTVERR